MPSIQSLNLNAADHPLAFEGQFESLDHYLNHLMHLRTYEEVLPLVRGQKVLDLGCNNGYGTDYIRTACADIVGIDVSATAIQDGRARFGASGLRLELYDGVTLPFPDSTFDVVISFQVIEHIDVDLMPRYLGGAARVLKPGSVAVFSTPNGRVRVAPGARPWNPFHVREFSPDELKALLSPYFRSMEVYGMFGSPLVYRRVLDGYLRMKRGRPAPSWRRVARQCLPWLVPIVHRVREFRKLHQRQAVDTSLFSTKDFHYTSENLDDALDLLAICRTNNLGDTTSTDAST